MDNKSLIKALESILTIDGKGRPRKAQELLTLLETTDKNELVQAVKEISERKFL